LAPAAPTPDDLALLTSYPWPGNVRELGAVIDRAAILGDGKCLEVAKALGIGADSSGAALEIERPRPASRQPSGPIEPLNMVIRQHIEAALAVARGRIEGRQGAAALLQVNPHTLRAKMRKLGIDWAGFRDNQ
jgi:DNA-binding NtrC family response regulator